MFLSAYRASLTGWSILFLKLVFIFLYSLKLSHSTPWFFRFGIFGDKSMSPDQKRSRIEEIMPQAFVMFYVIVRITWIHSGSLVTMSWRPPRKKRKYQLFARFYNKKTLTVPLRNVSKLVRREDHLLNKPPNSMLLESKISINFIPWLASVGMLSLIPLRHPRL